MTDNARKVKKKKIMRGNCFTPQVWLIISSLDCVSVHVCVHLFCWGCWACFEENVYGILQELLRKENAIQN